MKDIWRRVRGGLRAGGTDRRGSIAVMTALMCIPLFLAAGLAVDLARLVLAQHSLQSAVDDASLAGAAAYTAATNNAIAVTVATNYFNNVPLGAGVAVVPGSLVITALPGTMYNKQASYNVSTTVSASIQMTFMSLAKISTISLSAKATAGNPLLQAIITVQNGGGTAVDWNSVWMYPVPNGTNGKPDFSQFVPLASMYEISSTCQGATNGEYQANAVCNSMYGASVPNPQTFPTVASTTPLAFMFANLQEGSWAKKNQYDGMSTWGAVLMEWHFLMSANLALGLSPSQYDNGTEAAMAIFATSFQGFTSQANAYAIYPTTASTTTSNCALQVAVVNTAQALPYAPPTTGKCFAPGDTSSGYQYANLSCSQMNGRTFEYWWNDMGGDTTYDSYPGHIAGAAGDNLNYADVYYTVSCKGSGNVATNGDSNPNYGVALIN